MSRRLDPQWLVQVPEHAALSLTPAGPWPRGWAWMIDLAVRVTLFFAVCFVVLLGIMLVQMAQGSTSGDGSFASVGIILLLYFLLDWLYHVVFEAGRRGQTPGKRAMGIQVVDYDGRPPGWRGAALRNLLRYIDWLPVGYALGLTVAAGDSAFRRLGDRAAGTLVVYSERGPAEQLHEEAASTAAQTMAQRLPRRIVRYIEPASKTAIDRFLAQRKQFSRERRQEMARHLALPLARSAGIPPPKNADLMLCGVGVLLREDQLQRDAGSAKALLEQRRQQWQQAETLLSEHRGDAAAQLAIADLHRGACADLALADCYRMPSDLRRDLADLVARGHGHIHQRETRASLAQLGAALYLLPQRIRRDPCAWVGVLVFLLPFWLIWWIASGNPAWAASVVGEDQLAMFEAMYRDVDFTDQRGADMSSGMTGFYIFNNVSIALSCYAAGFFLGIGALAIVVWNAVVLGVICGHLSMADPHISEPFMEFIAAHGPFELTGIGLCAGAGLRLGWGMWTAADKGWSNAIRQGAQRSLPLVAGGALLVAAAAPIEGFISPSSLSYATKQGVAWVCWGLLLLAAIGLAPWRWREARHA